MTADSSIGVIESNLRVQVTSVYKPKPPYRADRHDRLPHFPHRRNLAMSCGIQSGRFHIRYEIMNHATGATSTHHHVLMPEMPIRKPVITELNPNTAHPPIATGVPVSCPHAVHRSNSVSSNQVSTFTVACSSRRTLQYVEKFLGNTPKNRIFLLFPGQLQNSLVITPLAILESSCTIGQAGINMSAMRFWGCRCFIPRTVSIVSLSATPLRPVRWGKVPVPRSLHGYPTFFRQSRSGACAEWLPVDLKLSNCK